MPRGRSSLRFLVLVVALLVAGVAVLAYVAGRPSSPADRATVVLTPVPGTRPDPAALADAAAVLRLRLGALDRRARVTVTAGTLVVSAPRSLSGQLKQLGSPGQLEMRPVLATHQPTTGCTKVRRLDLGDLDRPSTACSADGATGYSLGPARLTGSSVDGADANAEQQVVIHLTTSGRRQFAQLTRELSTKPAPTNELAIVVDGVVVSAPVVAAVIVGDTQVSGGFTPAQAKALAVTIRYGGLPLAFAISGG